MAQAELEGEVRGFRQWAETINDRLTNQENQQQVWTFQLERHQAGQHLPPIPVEMRGQSFSGVLNEGHIVRLDRRAWTEGQTVRTDHVYNVTLNTPVVARGKDIRGQVIVSALIVLAFLAFVVWGIIQINR